MKTQIKMKNIPRILLATVLAAGLAACDADPIDTTRGELPDKEPLENTYARLRSTRSATNIAVIGLTEGNDASCKKRHASVCSRRYGFCRGV